MINWLRRADRRTVVIVVALDALSYLLVYWVVVPAFEDTIVVMDDTAQVGLGHVLTAVRLSLVGLLAARSLRRRAGLLARSDAVPSITVGAVTTMTLGLVLSLLGRSLVDIAAPPMFDLSVGVVEYLVFPLFGLLFVTPGPADGVRDFVWGQK